MILQVTQSASGKFDLPSFRRNLFGIIGAGGFVSLGQVGNCRFCLSTERGLSGLLNFPEFSGSLLLPYTSHQISLCVGKCRTGFNRLVDS